MVEQERSRRSLRAGLAAASGLSCTGWSTGCLMPNSGWLGRVLDEAGGQAARTSVSGRTNLCVERRIVRTGSKIDISWTIRTCARQIVHSNTLSTPTRPREHIHRHGRAEPPADQCSGVNKPLNVREREQVRQRRSERFSMRSWR